MDKISEKDLEELLNLKRKQKKKSRFSKFIVTLVILLNVVFTAAVLYVYLQVGTEPATLIGAWFGFTTVELWALAGIKKREIETQNDREEI